MTGVECTVLVLDVDGVFALWPEATEHTLYYPKRVEVFAEPLDYRGARTTRVRTMHGRSYEITFRPDIVDRLDRLVHALDLELVWLTSWGPNSRALTEQAFGGLLTGPVLAREPKKTRGRSDPWWKVRAIRDLHAAGRSYIWVDDELIAAAVAHHPYFQPGGELEAPKAPRLLLPTQEAVGLTHRQLDRIEAFARRPRTSKP